MAYTPTIWQVGSEVTPQELNHIEEGVTLASEERAIVELTPQTNEKESGILARLYTAISGYPAEQVRSGFLTRGSANFKIDALSTNDIQASCTQNTASGIRIIIVNIGSVTRIKQYQIADTGTITVTDLSTESASTWRFWGRG